MREGSGEMSPEATPLDDPVAQLTRLEPDELAVRFRLLPKDQAAEVFDALDPPQQGALLDELQAGRVRELVEQMDPDDRVRMLDELPAIVARKLIAGLTSEERRMTATLLGYPNESAGRIMSPEHAELRPELTVEDALARVRRAAPTAETVYVLPVRDAGRHLVGVVELRDLLAADPAARVADLVDGDYPAVSVVEDQEAVARLIQERDLIAVPVVDREHRLVGIVTVDDAMQILEEEETEDIARVGAAEPLRQPYFAVSVSRLVRTRVVWLLFLVAAASLTVSVLSAFEATLEQVVALALFIPLLIGTGGNTGAQAATTMTRALAVGDVRASDVAQTVFKEMRVGFLLGALLGALGFLPITLLFDSELASVVCISLLAVCPWATTVGSILPLAASRVGIDPAVVSAPLVTTLVDATGLLIYFGFAQLLIL
jgi:magnesium transporter